jgi:hypothetical protein
MTRKESKKPGKQAIRPRNNQATAPITAFSGQYGYDLGTVAAIVEQAIGADITPDRLLEMIERQERRKYGG